MTITVTLSEINEAGCWDEFCQDYNVDEYCLRNGKAWGDETYEISLAHAKKYNLLNEESNEQRN